MEKIILYNTAFGTVVIHMDLQVILPLLVVVKVKVGHKPIEVVPLWHVDHSFATKNHYYVDLLYSESSLVVRLTSPHNRLDHKVLLYMVCL